MRRYGDILEEITLFDDYRKKLQLILETKGEGIVDVYTAAYPETYIEIKKIQKRIESIVRGSFYAMDSVMHYD